MWKLTSSLKTQHYLSPVCFRIVRPLTAIQNKHDSRTKGNQHQVSGVGIGKERTIVTYGQSQPLLQMIQSYKTSNQTSGEIEDNYNFTLVYFIKHLYFIRLISLSKVYQTVLVAGFFPFIYHKWSTQAIADTTFYGSTFFLFSSTIMLYVIASYFTRLACAVYVDPKAEKVKISHLSLRTRKRDVILDLKDIVPISETSQSVSDFYFDLMTYDKKYKFKLFLRMGTIHNEKLLIKLLGNVF